ncbi:MAG: ribosome small subunit-dependent GTPase A [Gammaproteobacteria bacterium]
MSTTRNRHDSHTRDESGRVVAAFGRRVLVEDSEGARHACMLAGRRLRPVCGDRVTWQRPRDHSDGLVTSIEPRRSELARPSRRGDREVLAANVTQVVVVSAPKPTPDAFLVDRYLVAAELMGAAACIAYNKTDLDPDGGAIDLGEFESLGYPVIRICARNGTGLDRLRPQLEGHTSILVGHSGVGKSSIINALLPDAGTRTAALSDASGEGRHTTTASVLHHLPTGGELVDSPGVRDYAPPPVSPGEVGAGFREIASRDSQCRFSDCLHLREPGCAVKAAVEAGEISDRRYESYRRLVRLMEKLSPGP